MNETPISKLTELTPSCQEALRDCAKYPPGKYVFKPATMQRLSALGLTCKTESGAYRLTEEGADLVCKAKKGIRS